MKKVSSKVLAAEIISWLSAPPLVGTVFFIYLIFNYASDFSQGLKWIVVISPFLIFIPLLFFAIGLKLGWVSDWDLSERKERPAFLLTFTTGLILASAALLFLKVPTKFFVYVFSGLVLTLVTSIITLYWKISFHTAVATSVVSAVLILGGLHYWPFFLLIPIVGWARVVLKKHTLWQVISGSAVALIIAAAIFYLFGFNILGG